jgi:hypothetical protein
LCSIATLRTTEGLHDKTQGRENGLCCISTFLCDTQSDVSNIDFIVVQAQGGGFASFGLSSFQAVI